MLLIIRKVIVCVCLCGWAGWVCPCLLDAPLNITCDEQLTWYNSELQLSLVSRKPLLSKLVSTCSELRAAVHCSTRDGLVELGVLVATILV